MECPFDPISTTPLAISRATGTSHGSENLSMDVMGNLLADMLSCQFHPASSLLSCNQKASLGFQDLMEFSDQTSRSTHFHILEENNGNIEELQSYNPFYLMKLPVLEDQPKQEAQRAGNHVISGEEFLQKSSYAAGMDGKTISAEACELRYSAGHPKYVKDAIVKTSIVSYAGDHEICENINTQIASYTEETSIKANSENYFDQRPPDYRLGSLNNLLCGGPSQSSSGTDTQRKPKKKRVKSCKNSEEVESQRQTHIAVERNRRKQMNENLSILRSLMPGSYVPRGDQASIIGGAIEFVKELEQLLECLQAQKRRRTYAEAFSPKPSMMILQPPTLPIYSPRSDQHQLYSVAADSKYVNDNFYESVRELLSESKSEVAEVEVKVLGGDAFVKILSQRRPGQLLKTIAALESLCMTILHTNITTIEQTVLYSFNVRLGAECNLNVDEIAEAVQHIFTIIHNGCNPL